MLTDAKIKSLKPADKMYSVSDGESTADEMTKLVTAISEVNGFDDKLADIKKN